jgi:Na+-translocating ferredoxin:NAD+ oxidoreductase RnfC subunit
MSRPWEPSGIIPILERLILFSSGTSILQATNMPLHVGCVVTNVETLYNVHLARKDIPVTRKFVSVAGAVKQPKSFWVPIGTSFQDIIELAGGATVSEFGMFVNGIMMGRLSFDLEDVVTRTTAGLIVLPKEHYLVNRKSQPLEAMNRIGKSACDQCSYCTEFCPRYLLGYEVQPHKVMRSLGFSMSGADNWNQWAELCCACGLCTLYACPEDLFPKEACDQAKTSMRVGGINFVQKSDVRVHPMKEYRCVPLAQLRKRLKIEEYETETPFEPVDFRPGLVRIKLSQHAGKPAKPVVTPGEKVGIGAVVGRVDAPDLGVNIHSSINGTVKSVTGTFIEIHP